MATKISEKQKIELIDKMTSAMIGPESSGWNSVNITAQEKDKKTIAPTYALGQYQFVPHLHLDSIKELVKDNAKFTKAQRDAIAKLPSQDEWKKMRAKEWSIDNAKAFDEKVKTLFAPILNDSFVQKEYYSQWMNEKIIPAAEKQYERYGKKLGWSLEAFVSLNHNRGVDGANSLLYKASQESDLIRGTKDSILNKPMDSSNKISPNDYVKKFEDNIKKSGGVLTTNTFKKLNKSEIIAADKEYDQKLAEIKQIKDPAQRNNALDELNNDYLSKFGEDRYQTGTDGKKGYTHGTQKILNNFITEENNILKSNKTKEEKAAALNLLYEDINSAGMLDVWNNRSTEQNAFNKKASEDFQSGKSQEGFIHKLMQIGTIEYKTDPNAKTIKLSKSDPKFQEKLNEYRTNGYEVKVTALGNYNITPKVATLNIDGNNLTKEERDRLRTEIGKMPGVKISAEYLKNIDISLNKGVLAFTKKTDDYIKSVTGEYLYRTEKTPFSMVVKDKNGNFVSSEEKTVTTANSDYKKTIDFDSQRAHVTIDPNSVRNRTAERNAEREAQEAEEERLRQEAEASNEDETSTTTVPTEKELNKKAEDYFSNYLTKEEVDVPETFKYDEGNFAEKIPFEAIGQGALGLMGLAQADEELPLRTDDVSEAIKAMAAEQKRLSELGLKPEEEAAMKANIADVYNEGINQLTRASGGDRNVVLGGIQNLNLNRLQGISAISLADIQRKDEMLKQYNETVKYIDSFNQQKNKDNYNIKVQEATEKRQAGAQLAASGFSNMLNEIQHQRENGPGSANHRFQQSMLFKLNGYVPGMKDNGLGDTPGTFSYYQRQNQNIITENEFSRAFNLKKEQEQAEWNSYSPEKKAELNASGYWEKKMQENVELERERNERMRGYKTAPTNISEPKKAQVSPSFNKEVEKTKGILNPFIPTSINESEEFKIFNNFNTKPLVDEKTKKTSYGFGSFNDLTFNNV